jgi:O-antigen ligase
MLFWLITAFAAYCVIISFILYMPPVKSDTFYYGRKNAPYMYTSVLALFALYIMLKKREIKIRDIAIFSVAGLVAGFLIGLSYYFFSWTEYVFTYPPRYKAISSQPTFLSRSAGTAAALLCLWYLKKPFNLYFFSSLFAVVGVVGLSSGTRAFLIAYVMFFVAFYGYLLFKHQKRTAISAGVSIAFLITLFIVLGFIFEESRKLLIGKMDIMATERAYDPDALDPGRLGLWKRYITDWVSNPLTFFFGRGFLWWDTLGVGTHNSVLHLLHKTGLIGFALCMTIYIMFLLRALDLKNIKSQIMPLVFFFMYCAVFLMVDTTITRPDFLFMCLGLFLVMYVPPAGADTDKTLPTGEGTKSTTSKSEKQKSDV